MDPALDGDRNKLERLRIEGKLVTLGVGSSPRMELALVLACTGLQPAIKTSPNVIVEVPPGVDHFPVPADGLLPHRYFSVWCFPLQISWEAFETMSASDFIDQLVTLGNDHWTSERVEALHPYLTQRPVHCTSFSLYVHGSPQCPPAPALMVSGNTPLYLGASGQISPVYMSLCLWIPLRSKHWTTSRSNLRAHFLHP